MKLVIKLCFFLGAASISAEEPKPGPVGDIKMHSIYECSEPVNLVNFEYWLGERDGKKVLDASIDLGVDVADDDLKIVIKVDKYDSAKDQWVETAGLSSRELFPLVNSFVPEIWKNMREKMSPQIKEPTRIPAGAYELKDFTADYTDFKSQMIDGKLRGEVRVTHDDEDIICLIAEVEVYPLIPKF